jgi:uncharacterized SAM-binding protein YcdF (DUF218 family)
MRSFLRQAAGPFFLALAALVLALASSSLAVRAVALALFGIACVIAVSLVFLAVGRSEDAERAASAPPPPPPPSEPHERPALKRGRPRPPRRPA